MYRIVAVNSNKRYGLPLTQLQPPNIVDRATISVMELSEMHHRIEEQQKKVDDREMLGTAGLRFDEELGQLKLEDQNSGDQLLETKRLLVCAGNQRKSCRRHVEILKKELEEVTNVAETKTREYITLVDERGVVSSGVEEYRGKYQNAKE